MEIFYLLAVLGAFAGFMSGMLGIGGGIILAPLLLYVPEWLGLPPLPMKDVAGLTIVHGLVACLTGSLIHNQFKFVSRPLMGWMGITIFVTALIGGIGTGYVPNEFLLAIFALLALSAAVILLVPTRAESEAPDIVTFSFSRVKAVYTAGLVGLLGGLVGQGGSFILIPLMTSFVQVPTRIAIGSNLAIVFFSSLAAFLGKAFTGQILWLMTLPIIIAVIPAAHLGSLLSRKVPVARLRTLLAVFIALAAIRIGISAVQGF